MKREKVKEMREERSMSKVAARLYSYHGFRIIIYTRTLFTFFIYVVGRGDFSVSHFYMPD